MDALLRELESSPRRIYALRQEIAPLKAEMRMLQSRYESKGPRSPSHFDIYRAMLLSELKEEARRNYRLRPDVKETTRGTRHVELTDGRAEDLAHANERYAAFVEAADKERQRINDLQRQIDALWDRIEGLKGRKEYLTQVIEMAKAATYAWAAEARLTPR